jgi:hypothetical protein
LPFDDDGTEDGADGVLENDRCAGVVLLYTHDGAELSSGVLGGGVDVVVVVVVTTGAMGVMVVRGRWFILALVM